MGPGLLGSGPFSCPDSWLKAGFGAIDESDFWCNAGTQRDKAATHYRDTRLRLRFDTLDKRAGALECTPDPKLRWALLAIAKKRRAGFEVHT